MTTPRIPAAGTPLTRRELQVLDGLSRGRSNAEIGTTLFITPNTVKSHCLRLYAKLGARDRGHAVGIAYRTGLLALPHRSAR
ncbi:helix-turn-helix transcriptional regulator [Streptomyces sp. AV19]|uniref:response regulator transcription factor n=1 Tax=Streptomyces sp. AV19 TaxID=2793068 RepID=UPI0018FE0863|nr:helix-turn-helix transcriptional regulator [Streptomyces sp. AV19]